MWCKRAEASGGVALLDPARLKPRTQSECKRPGGDTDDETGNPKRPAHGDLRPYKIQRELERLGIDAEYLRAMAWTCFTSVRSDASCGAFSPFVHLRRGSK